MKRLVSTTLVVVLLRASSAWADGPPQLLLPLLAALAMGRSALELHATSKEATIPGAPRLGFIPSAIRIPDLYAIDVAERDPRRYAEPVDRDNQVALNLLPRRHRGMMLKLSYDTEELPIGDGWDLFRVVIQFEW